MAKPLIRRRRGDYEPDDFICVGESMTKQAPAEETDVNLIVARYVKTGDTSALMRVQGSFADVSTIGDFNECMQKIKGAESAFQELPAEIRDYFNNDPGQLADAMSNPARVEELTAMGLLREDKPTSSPATAPAGPAAPAATAAPAGHASGAAAAPTAPA